jgi:hypothetical protein
MTATTSWPREAEDRVNSLLGQVAAKELECQRLREATRAGPTGTEARVCADIAARQQLGLRKYGISVEGNPLTLREWLQHAYEETLDQAIYLRRSIEQIDLELGNAP